MFLVSLEYSVIFLNFLDSLERTKILENDLKYFKRFDNLIQHSRILEKILGAHILSFGIFKKFPDVSKMVGMFLDDIILIN